MYKVLIADDEGIVIDSLKFIIEKEFFGKCEIQSAKTGRDVIELAEIFRPDIAIMDIQMPGINGIEAMKEIRKTNKNIIFIVSSAYDKFDYASESIKLGVLEYLTKPVERKKITQTLEKAFSIIEKDREERHNDLLIKEKLETVIPIIESGLIYSILLKEHFEEDVKHYKTILGITEQFGYMVSIVCGDKQEGNHMTNAVGSSVKMQNHYQDVREYVKEYLGGIVGTVMSNKISVLVPYKEEIMEYNDRIELIERTRELTRKMKKAIGSSFRIGIGGTKELSKMSDSYREAVQSLVNSTGSVAHIDDLLLNCEYEEDYPIKLERKMFDEIEKGDLDNTIISSEQYFEWMISNHENDKINIKLKVLEFVFWAEHIAYKKGGMTYRFTSRGEYLPTIIEMEDMMELKEWFVNKMSIACQNIISKRVEKSNSIIEKTKKYIMDNYQKDISLDKVSCIVNISPYYFSKFFKEETGENFIDYLTNIRIEKAKELLDNSQYSMKEICSMVGYQDPNYFSRSFKKNVGMTPTEYKEGKVEKNYKFMS
ncbi:MAG: response regulator [Lachnospiraceae bacterium]